MKISHNSKAQKQSQLFEHCCVYASSLIFCLRIHL